MARKKWIDEVEENAKNHISKKKWADSDCGYTRLERLPSGAQIPVLKPCKKNKF